MLLFKPFHIPPILSGRKVETRRQWRTWRAKVGSIHKAKTKMLSPEYFAELEILRRWEECLGDISEKSIHNEGYDSREQYVAVWEEINKRPWNDDEIVKVLLFQVVGVSMEYLEKYLPVGSYEVRIVKESVIS